jgi:chorismate dehydratase
MRIGAVNYLNSKPLVYGLEQLAPGVQLCFDLPSRLADSLAAGRLDVALIPSVEFFRASDCTIVSDACVACRGPVLSVKLHFRVQPTKVRRVALDEGSRTSAALTQILLAELCGVRPQWEPLPIGCGLDSTDADAVLLIGDRAIASEEPPQGYPARREERAAIRPVPGAACEVWDLGERWSQWTRLPFVFAMWVARPETDTTEVATILTAARNQGIRHLKQIAEREAPALEISSELASTYLGENLHFALGRKECEGLRQFYRLCLDHRLAPPGLEFQIEEILNGCPVKQ